MLPRLKLKPLNGIGAVATLFSFLLLLTCPALAAAQAMVAPVIASAIPNYATTPPTLTLVGYDFGTDLPSVTIDYLPAVILSYTNTQLVVQIPAAVYATPGSYGFR